MYVESTVTIERPIEEVFEFVSTPENDPTWVPNSLRHQRTLPGPMRVGMTTEETMKYLGRTSRDTWEVTEYELPTVVAYRATSGLLSGAVFAFDASQSRTAPGSRTLQNGNHTVCTTGR